MMRFGSIEWRNLKITIPHNSGFCGSAHTLFRHRNDFRCILTKQQGMELEKIEQFDKDAQKHRESETKRKDGVQDMVDGIKKMLRKVEGTFVNYVQKSIHEAKQMIVTFSSGELVIFFRRTVNDETFWKMIVSDGIRYDKFKPDEEMKLITCYRRREKNCKLEDEHYHFWYDWDTRSVMSKKIGRKEGLFIEINKEVIDDEQGIFLRLFRESHPSYAESDETLRHELKRLLHIANDKNSEQPKKNSRKERRKEKRKNEKRNNKKKPVLKNMGNVENDDKENISKPVEISEPIPIPATNQLVTQRSKNLGKAGTNWEHDADKRMISSFLAELRKYG